MRSTSDYKQSAVDQWTADPCGAREAEGDQGTREYFESLLAARQRYAPWMDEEFGYAGTRGLRVLDVGCGQGIDLARYAAAGADAVGVDLTPRHVELARRHLESLGLLAEAVAGDAESLPFPDASFDRASSNGVLHHTPDMAAALGEIRRVLRPGGEVRITVYNRGSFHYWLTQVAFHGILRGLLLRERSMNGVLSRTVEFSSVGARPLVRVYRRGELRRTLTAAGFIDVEVHARHFNFNDTPPTALLGLIPGIPDAPGVRDRVGRLGGWYLVAHGRRPEGTVAE